MKILFFGAWGPIRMVSEYLQSVGAKQTLKVGPLFLGFRDS